MAYKKNRQYGYLNRSNDGVFFDGIQGQQVGGYSVGIVYIEQINYPILPGNVVNANTYDFPVRMQAVKNLTNDRLFNNDKTIANDVIDAAKSMVENDGCRAICSACGFFGNFQKEVASALDVPFAMSSLVQLPWIKSLITPGKKVGILTANGGALNSTLFENCGIHESVYKDIVVRDMLQSKEFAAVVDMRGHMDNAIAREEIIAAAKSLVEENDDLGAILLECSDMPPYAAEIQAVTQLPVFDFITLIRWMHSAVNQKPYSGWI